MSISEEPKQTEEGKFGTTRRELGKMALGGAALLASASKSSGKLNPLPPGIKLGSNAWTLTDSNQPTEENILFLKQIGVEWVTLNGDRQNATAEGFAKQRQAWEAGGIKIYGYGSATGPRGGLHNMAEVTLNLPGRDQKIEDYLNCIRYLGKAGIPYVTYAHMADGVWRGGRVTSPRGYSAAEFDLANPETKTRAASLLHGRKFTEEEIWDNYTYFIKKVAPVAEEAGVRIGIHPDDPPQPVLAGVPRCIFSSFEGYKKALEIANSPNIGMCLCCGCWLEGGPLMGKDVVETIKYFSGQKKLFKVHFRNVSATLPHFNEALIDDGYYDMSKVMKALVDVNFQGLVIPDHVPVFGKPPAEEAGRGGGRVARKPGEPYYGNPAVAYLVACMRGMHKAALSGRG